MKTPGCHLLATMILPCALLLNQCAPTGGTSPQAVAAVAPYSHHWVKVSSHPPTFYPRGVAADCPTDFRSGEWVYTEDNRGTRFFIPFRGVEGGQRQGLLQEALACRTEKKRNRIADEEVKPRDVATAVALMPVVVPAMAATAVFAPWWFFRDRWKDGHP